MPRSPPGAQGDTQDPGAGPSLPYPTQGNLLRDRALSRPHVLNILLFGLDIPEVLSAPAILSSVNEAKQLVDAAYKHARKRSKQALEEDKVNPSDFLKHLTEPVAGTRSAIRSADYMETTLSLLKKKLQQNMKRPFNITGNVRTEL
ncbi:hypothetical protein Y1Q_0003945 [Alligator mississippiensis]|uniref:Uncharacterized protein n=1 Tax=Alligator mississippiensis TaxID=8496 RepID=A0A151PHM4_ALLMI|nr:hypothetical protein Y1Q_0003945 [Alligator mississippiensis]